VPGMGITMPAAKQVNVRRNDALHRRRARPRKTR
jgi:hypothetical protein